MATSIVLRVDDDDQADDLLRDIRGYPMHDLLTPCVENKVQAHLVAAARDGQPYRPAPPEPDARPTTWTFWRYRTTWTSWSGPVRRSALRLSLWTRRSKQPSAAPTPGEPRDLD